MFFSLPFEYPPCGLFGWGHATLFFVTVLLIAGGLFAARNADGRTVRRIVRISTLLLWVLEMAKILFVLFRTGSRNPNDFVPLYYCSLVLYAGLFSSFGKGWVRRVGDVFLATGGMIGGACFLFCPNTSLPRYPMFHFISLHSFLLHGLMVFLGLLLLLRGVVRLSSRDVICCAGLVSAMCAAALIFNNVYSAATGTESANLMFMSRDFPGTPVHLLYVLTGKAFPVVMWLLQAFVPYYAVFFTVTLCTKRRQESGKIKDAGGADTPE